MTDETAGYGRRLRDPEAEAFRTGRILAGHSEHSGYSGYSGHLATTGQRQDDASRSVEQRLDAIERALSALARAQNIDPAAPG